MLPAYKVASFEIVDIPLIEYIAARGKPVIISTGMAAEEEIEEAIRTARCGGAAQIALLKCTSAYPSPPDEMNLRHIPYLAGKFGLPVGLPITAGYYACRKPSVARGPASSKNTSRFHEAPPLPTALFP
jgi:sialic acid synthase SpsE